MKQIISSRIRYLKKLVKIAYNILNQSMMIKYICLINSKFVIVLVYAKELARKINYLKKELSFNLVIAYFLNGSVH